jgi:hypothetical protein
LEVEADADESGCSCVQVSQEHLATGALLRRFFDGDGEGVAALSGGGLRIGARTWGTLRAVDGVTGPLFPHITIDGRFVVIGSSASNLVAGADSGGVFVRDRMAGTTERVGDGGVGPAVISADGRFEAESRPTFARSPGRRWRRSTTSSLRPPCRG